MSFCGFATTRKVMRSLYVVGCCILFFSICLAQNSDYQPTEWDRKLFEQLEERIDTIAASEGNSRVTYLLARLQEHKRRLREDPQAVYVLSHLEWYLFETIYRLKQLVNGETSVAETKSDTPTFVLEWLSKETFFIEFSPMVRTTLAPPAECISHYQLVDRIAQEHNFPTPLIIATRRRERSCMMSNPDNRWWLFQITSHDYPPGPVTKEQLAEQILHFIEFSRAKWSYYDYIQVFDPLPIDLAYDRFDLRSIQKHAVLYNGVYSGVTPANSTYANSNFATGPDGRDGIVAMFLKVLGWELENL
jgi:hypothetical protein